MHGLVAKLVKVKDSTTATALEVAAGGKVSKFLLGKEIRVCNDGCASEKCTSYCLTSESVNTMYNAFHFPITMHMLIYR